MVGRISRHHSEKHPLPNTGIMTIPSWTHSLAYDELRKLTEPGVLGFYTHFEVTEIFGYKKGDASPINIFTLFVGEDRASAFVMPPQYLGDRITLKSMPGWAFGIKRYARPVQDILSFIENFDGKITWASSSETLLTAALNPVPPQFVPPDSLTSAPWNAVLKNNFWNGSYVLEWSDIAKSGFEPFFDRPVLLQELSAKIGQQLPLRLASFSDRLGNIVFQLPSTVLMASFGKGAGEFYVNVVWNPKATPRLLRATCELAFDGITSGYASTEITHGQVTLPVKAGDGTHKGVIWDDANQIMLAATGESAFINSFGLNMHASVPEPRQFAVPGESSYRRVALVNSNKSVVEAPDKPDASWTRKRIYEHETARLLAERKFVQYKPKAGDESAEHQRALVDIRSLITQYGEDGAWLWDPYLSATDILETLFYSPHVWADLRALTACKDAGNGTKKLNKTSFLEAQRDILDNLDSNFYGLRLEYRAKIGSAGWDFHDRFLIFPRKDERALAWSLGTSINSVGQAHHILQRVDDGQRVLDAFVELWDALAAPQNLVWRKP